MPLPPPSVSVRLRHSITLATQSVPLIALTIITWRKFNPATLLMLALLAISLLVRHFGFSRSAHIQGAR